ncbi:Calcineurin-like phosphoesterase, partial [Globisporangium splendens]
MRGVRFALLALCFTSAAASSTVLDDQQCTFASKTKTCEPAHACAFQYRFGDLSLDQSCRVVAAQVARMPQQLHLAFAGATAGTAMTISWSTYAKVDDPKVWLGTSQATVKLVEDDNVDVQAASYYSDRHYSLYTYHATLSGLKANTCYFFKVGCGSCDDNESSVISSFTTARSPPTASIDAGDASNGTNTTDDAFEVLVYGDFGLDENARATSAYLANLTRPLAFIYHIGDISYADNAFLSLDEVTGFHYEETYNR